MTNKLISALQWLKGRLFSTQAFLMITIVLLALLYMMLFKQNFSVKIIITFCVLCCLWLSIVINYIDSVVNTPQEIKDLIGKARTQTREARRYVYDFYRMPFYIIMGESGAGKTTLVQSSGLEKYRNLHDEEQGKGGTRGCDFFLRKQMILLDTAGLMTDNNILWQKFLERICEVRPLYPVNGVLVVIPVDTLCSSPGQKGPYNPYITGIPEDIKTIVTNKAKKIKERLIELKQTINFRIPVYVIISKCDLLEGFGDPKEKVNPEKRGFSEILHDTERSKIVGIAMKESFDREFDRCIEEIRQWYLMKTIQNPYGGADIGQTPAYYNGSKFIENLAALKNTLRIYHDILWNLCDLRGYFFSSCIPFLIGLQSEWAQATSAYFVYDLVHDKILKEKGLGKPDVEAVGARAVWQNRLKIATLGVILFLMILSGIYFYQNFSTFASLGGSTTRMSEELPEKIRKLPAIPYKHPPEIRKEINDFHQYVLDKTVRIYEDFKSANTSSALLVGSYRPLEQDFRKLSMIMFYNYLVKPTFTQFLYNWKEMDVSSIRNLGELVKFAKERDAEYKIFLEAKKSLDGFDKLYSWAFPDCYLGRDWPKVKNICQSSKSGAQILSEINEKEAIQKLREKLYEKLIELCKSPTYLPQGLELGSCYQKIVQIHSRISRDQNSTRSFDETKKGLEELKKAVDEWRTFVDKNLVKFKNPKMPSEILRYQQDFSMMHEFLIQEELNKNELLIKDLEKSVFLSLEEAQEIHKKYSVDSSQSVLTSLMSCKIMIPNNPGYLPTLYDELIYKVFQIDILPKLMDISSKKAWGPGDLSTTIGLLKTVSETSAPATVYLQYRKLNKTWEDTLSACFFLCLQYVQDSYKKDVEEANQWLMQTRLKEKYQQKIQSAVDATRDVVDCLAKFKEIASSDSTLDRFINAGDLSQISQFLKSEAFDKLTEIPDQRIQEKNLDESDCETILSFLPAVYCGQPRLNDCKNIISWAILYLQYNLTQKFSPVEDKIVEYWEKKSKELMVRLSTEEEWRLFYNTCTQGKNLYEKLKKPILLQNKYQNLIAELYVKMVKIFDLELKKDAWTGVWLIKGKFAFQDSPKFWEEANGQLRRYLDIFFSDSIPKEVLEKNEFYPRIKTLMQRFQKGKNVEFSEFIQTFTNVVMPWLQLKSDSQIEKISEATEISLSPDWIGKRVLDLFENDKTGYANFVSNRMSDQEFVPQVIIEWRKVMDPDFAQWHDVARKTVATILEAMEKDIQDKFPFSADSNTEIALSKVDNFFKTFALMQKHYKSHLIGSHHDLAAWKDFFKRWQSFFQNYEKWQKILYGDSNESLEKMVYEVKLVLPRNMPYYISRVSLCDTYWDCGNILKKSGTSWVKQREFTFTWKWGMNLDMLVESPPEVQVKFQSEKGRVHENKLHFDTSQYATWGLWAFIYKYIASVSEDRIELSFPHQIRSDSKTSLNLGALILPAGKPGKYMFPWK